MDKVSCCLASQNKTKVEPIADLFGCSVLQDELSRILNPDISPFCEFCFSFSQILHGWKWTGTLYINPSVHHSQADTVATLAVTWYIKLVIDLDVIVILLGQFGLYKCLEWTLLKHVKLV